METLRLRGQWDLPKGIPLIHALGVGCTDIHRASSAGSRTQRFTVCRADGELLSRLAGGS